MASKPAAKRAPAKKATSPAQSKDEPEPTVQVEVRVGNRIVVLQDVVKSSVKTSVAGGKVSVTARTAGAPAEGTPVVNPEQPVDEAVVAHERALAAEPNKAVEFPQPDPRVINQIHQGATVADHQAPFGPGGPGVAPPKKK